MVYPSEILTQCLLITLIAYNTEGIPSCVRVLKDVTEWYKYSFNEGTLYLYIQSIQAKHVNKTVRLTEESTKGPASQNLPKGSIFARVTLRKDLGSIICVDDSTNFSALANSIEPHTWSVTKERPVRDYTYKPTKKQAGLTTMLYKRVRRKAAQNDINGFLAVPERHRHIRADEPRLYVPQKAKSKTDGFFDFLDPLPSPEEQMQSHEMQNSLAGVSLNLPFFRLGTPSQAPQPMAPTEESAKMESVVECGRRDPRYDIASRIYGGEEIERGSWPWLVAIFHGGKPDARLLCGGTLVSSKAVITAAHCFVSMSDLDYVFVALGRHDIRNLAEDGSLNLQARVNIHPHYRNLMQDSSFDADIAVLQLVGEVRFNELIQPACLWPQTIFTSDIVSRTGLVAGWGEISNNMFQSTPRQAMIDVVSNEVCFKKNPLLVSVTTGRNFCAGRLDGTGPCRGDSGGGLLFNENGRWLLRGIVSVISNTMLAGCDHNSSYVVYTDVAQFRTWIDGLIQ